MSTWEKGQPRINKIYEDVGGWIGEVTWRDAKVERYPVKTLYMRCPLKVSVANSNRELPTDRKHVFSYYEQEVRRLRAEQRQLSQQ